MISAQRASPKALVSGSPCLYNLGGVATVQYGEAGVLGGPRNQNPIIRLGSDHLYTDQVLELLIHLFRTEVIGLVRKGQSRTGTVRQSQTCQPYALLGL